MKPTLLRNQKGLTIIELLVYLGLTVGIVTAASSFLVSITPVNRAIDSREKVTREMRHITDNLAFTIKNSYAVSVPSSQELLLRTKKIGMPGDLRTRYLLNGQTVLAGDMPNVEPPFEHLVPLHDTDVKITGLSFESIDSSVRITMTAIQGNETHSITTTVSPHQ